MAPSTQTVQYTMTTVNPHDSPQLLPDKGTKPTTPPPMPLHNLEKTPPSQVRGPSGQPPQRQTSYTSMKRDILYGAINEFHLAGSRLGAYDELLSRLNFDLTPTLSQGHTWFSCRGRKDDRTACPRMVPEVYFRTAVGKLLRAADKLEARGDDLIEELAAALSYSICSEHNRNIHKVVRAIKFLPVVQQWREERLPRAPAPLGPSGNAKSSSAKETPTSEPVSTPSTATTTPKSFETATDYFQESAPTKPLDIRGRIKVERPYHEFIRDTTHDVSRERNRERRSGSTASANTTSTSSTRSKSVERRVAERLGLGR